jgi:hypothetical protein
MKPTSIFRFERSPTAKTPYIFTGRVGADIPWFLGTYKKCKSKQYVILDATQYKKVGGRQHEDSLYTINVEAVEAVRNYKLSKAKTEDDKRKALAKDKARISGINFRPDFPNRTWGDTRNPALGGNDALLIELSPDWQSMVIYVFEGQAAAAQSLFEKWVSGELSLTLEADALALNEAEKKPDGN